VPVILAARQATVTAPVRIDYGENDTGVLSHLVTEARLQGLGIATLLIGAAEQRIRARGMTFAALGVEDGNPRARRLYERLGYRVFGRRNASWAEEDADGHQRLYETKLTMLRKRL
jgi:ribosomal protein S18 acetylase RimI-like enzyme